MEIKHRITAAELTRVLDCLTLLFDGARITEASGDAECRPAEKLCCVRSRPFLLETPSGMRTAALEIADPSLPPQLWEALYQDDLTHVYNRRYLNELRFLGSGAEVPRRMGVILLDLRRFKQINDTRGHLAGDGVLERVAAALMHSREEGEAVIRFGGDEFVVLAPGCGEERVPARIRALRAAVEEITPADFGYAWTDDFQADKHVLLRLLDVADRRMYGQKHRNGA